MPYFDNCYSTTFGRVHAGSNVKLEHALKESLIKGSVRSLGVQPLGEKSAVFITGSGGEESIPPFIHPYLIQGYKGNDYLITDARLFKTLSDSWFSDKDFENSVRNKTEYGLMKSRALVSLLWLDDSEKLRLRGRLSFAGTVYATWLAQAISRAYALDLKDQARMTAVGIYFYHLLFVNQTKLAGDELETAVVHTIKATKFPAAEVYSIFESLGEMKGIEDYCLQVSSVVENVRLKDFNLAMLATLIRNSWYGTNAKDMLLVALEHVPTWISIVYAAVTERSYKSSVLTKIAEFVGKRGGSDEFVINYRDMFQSHVLVLETIEDKPVFKDFED